MIEVRGLTKRYGATLAVDDLSFDVEPGKVTGFLGPNGAGKSTTMRMMLGLDRPTAGQALVNGRSFATLAEPLREVGALLDPGSVHPGRTGRNHLRVAARANGLPQRRVDEVIEQVGLGVGRPAAGSRATPWACASGSASRRHSSAIPACCCSTSRSTGSTSTASAGSAGCSAPLADEGRTVLVSSHLMSEMEQTADRLVVIGRGRLIADATTEEILRGLGHRQVRVRDVAARRAARPPRGARASPRSASTGTSCRSTTAPPRTWASSPTRSPSRCTTCPRSSSPSRHAYLELTGASVEFHGRPAQPARRRRQRGDGAPRPPRPRGRRRRLRRARVPPHLRRRVDPAVDGPDHLGVPRGGGRGDGGDRNHRRLRGGRRTGAPQGDPAWAVVASPPCRRSSRSSPWPSPR